MMQELTCTSSGYKFNAALTAAEDLFDAHDTGPIPANHLMKISAFDFPAGC